MPLPPSTLTADFLKDAVRHAPAATPTAKDLRGLWLTTESGLLYVCAPCSSRLHGRGILTAPSEPVWADRPEPFGVCVCCGK